LSAPRFDVRELRHEASLLLLVPRPPEPKRTGPETWKALCAFHAERTPSMQVRRWHDRGWRFHCFGCGEDGDVIDYVMRTRRIGFLEACAALGAQRIEGPPPGLHRAPWLLWCDRCGRSTDVETAEIPGIGHTSQSGWAHLADGRAYCPRCRLDAWARANGFRRTSTGGQ
jgi:hypothetical protein